MPCDLPTAGEIICDEALIDRPVLVRRHDPSAAEPTGWLHIRANTIIIEAGALIDVTGRGHRTEAVGSGWGDGQGDGGGIRGMQATPGAAAPGGGGAHVGAGGFGIADLGGCMAGVSATGGTSYDDASAPLALGDPLAGLGSAGGASHCGDTSDQMRPGGRGGGVVLLTAAQIRIDGEIRADGEGLDELGGNFGGCGPGAGSGGTIVIRTHVLELGAAAVLSARGGRGLLTQNQGGMDVSNSWGGGGGGGLIAIYADGSPAPAADVSGGVAACSAGDGQPGALLVSAPGGCVDADGDGHGSELCGGEDCDDGAADIHPAAVETCDAKDNDCNGATDEDSASLCPAGSGLYCHEGLCLTPNPAEPSPPPGVPEIELGGGLCAATFRSDRSAMGTLLVLFLCLLIRGSRRRPR